MDYYKDSGHLFSKIFVSLELPDFAKTGSYYDNVDELPDSSFGHPISRSFPLSDRANTYVSYAYAYAQKSNKIAQEALPVIEKAAALFGISGSLPALAEHIDGLLSKTAAVDPGWEKKTAAFQVILGAPTVHRIAGEGPDHVKMAIDRFLGLLSQVPFDNRTKVAQELIKAADENGAEYPEDLKKIAAMAETDVSFYKEQVALRANLVPDVQEKRAVLEALTLPGGHLAALQKIDETHKLARFYGHGITDPHRAVYNTIPKEAEVIKVGSKSYPMSRWDGAGGNFEKSLQGAFGQEKAASLIVDGKPKLDGLNEQEAALLNIYLS